VRQSHVGVCGPLKCDEEIHLMSTIPVELPDHLMTYVDRCVEQAGYGSASEYIASLVAAVSEQQAGIEQALMAGIASGPAEPWTDGAWQAIRNRVVVKASGQ